MNAPSQPWWKSISRGGPLRNDTSRSRSDTDLMPSAAANVMTSRRIEWIDAAKGLGIWLVAAGHILSAGGGASLAERIIWTFHMPLFFFLSGLTARATNGIDLRSDLLKAARTILIPYVVFSVLSIALYSIKRTSTPSQFGEQILEMLYGVSGKQHWMSYNVPLWFFPCLFCVRVLFLGLRSWLRKPLRVLAASLVIAATAHALFMLPIPRLPWNLDVALCALVFYSTGHAWGARQSVGEYVAWTWRVSLVLIFAAVVYGVAILNGRIDMNCRGFGSPVLFYIGAFAGIIVVSLIAKSLSSLRCLVVVGMASIVIFPMHGLLDYFIPSRALSIVQWYTLRITGSNTASALIYGAFEVACCMAFYWVFKRYAPILIGRTRDVKVLRV